MKSGSLEEGAFIEAVIGKDQDESFFGGDGNGKLAIGAGGRSSAGSFHRDAHADEWFTRGAGDPSGESAVLCRYQDGKQEADK